MATGWLGVSRGDYCSLPFSRPDVTCDRELEGIDAQTAASWRPLPPLADVTSRNHFTCVDMWGERWAVQAHTAAFHHQPTSTSRRFNTNTPESAAGPVSTRMLCGFNTARTSSWLGTNEGRVSREGFDGVTEKKSKRAMSGPGFESRGSSWSGSRSHLGVFWTLTSSPSPTQPLCYTVDI